MRKPFKNVGASYKNGSVIYSFFASILSNFFFSNFRKMRLFILAVLVCTAAAWKERVVGEFASYDWSGYKVNKARKSRIVQFTVTLSILVSINYYSHRVFL